MYVRTSLKALVNGQSNVILLSKTSVVRKRFDTLADARLWIDGQASQKSHIQATALTPGQLAEAKDAFTKLNGASLTEAVRFYLAHAKPAGGTKKFAEAIDALLKSKADAGRSRLHLRHLGWSLKKVAAAFPKRNVNEIHRHHLEDWLNAQSYGPKTRLNYVRDLKHSFQLRRLARLDRREPGGKH